MKPHIKRQKQIPYRLKPQLLAWSIAACFATHAAWALPTGAQVAAGSASFNQLGNTLNIANTPGAIINWNNFSIGALEAVRFQQQNSLSAVLNRVTGTTSSALHGALSSNGRVFLINPNGILFGAGSRVDVNGLIASTLNLSDRDFLAGRLNFTAGNLAGGIQNAGSLQANTGNIYLIAPDIANSGIVHAPNGEVLLAAGRQVSLVDAAHPDIQVVVCAPGDKAVNLGELVAGKISVFGALIQQKGIASADTVAVDDHGRIVFRATQQLDVAAGSRTTANGAAGGTVALQSAGDTYVSGSIEAQGNAGAGGTAQVLGNRVAVMDAASIDTSGATGGGRIMVGGDYRGGNSAVQNAQITYFGPHASLKANATKVGAGGTVIVWADDTTRAHGAVEARGGPEGGNGGFAETSGNYLETAGIRIDLGQGGTWLLDPYDITIGANPLNSTNDATTPLTFTGTASAAVVAANLINAALDAGTSVIVDTTGGGADSGDITVDTAITKGSGGDASLTLKAHDDIFVNVPIAATTGKLNVTLLANQTGTAPSGSIAIVGSGGIATNGGDFSANSKSISIGGVGIATAAGNIALTSTSGTITQTAGITGAALSINNEGSATLTHASNAVGSLTASGNGHLYVTTSGALTVASINKPAANVYLIASNAIAQTGTIAANQLDVESVASTIALDNAGNDVARFKGQAASSILFKNNGAFEVEAVSNTGDVTLYNLGSGNISTFGDSLGLKAVGGDITVNGHLDNIGSIEVGSIADPVHSLTVTGNFSQATGQIGSYLNLYASSPATHGSASITGSATLGGTLNIGGSPSAGSYPILSAASISGTFDSIVSSTFVPTYSGGNISIAVPSASQLFTWDDGGAAGVWQDPLNWNLDSSFPGSNGGVANAHVTIGPTYTANIITDVGTIYSLGGLGTINISGGGALGITGLSNTFSSLNISAGTLTALGHLNLSALNMTGGVLQGGGISGAANTLSITDAFLQSAGNIENFNAVEITQLAGLTVGNISTVIPSGGYSSGSQNGVIKLTATNSGATIDQAAGTTLGGAAISATAYGGVSLTNANPTGIIAGVVTDVGNFAFASTNSIKVDNVNGTQGINVNSGFARLETSYSGNAFTQNAPIAASSGLLLVGGIGSGAQSVDLKHASNNFSTFAIDLDNASTVGISQGGTAAMAVGTVDGIAGLDAPGATKLEITNTNAAGSLNIGEAMTVGATADVLLFSGSGGLTIAQPLSAKNFSLHTDGTISLTAALTGSDWVHLSNYTTGGTFKINSGGCTGACIDIADFPDIAAPGGIAFGTTDTRPTGSLQVNAAIDTTNFAGATKPAFVALLAGSGSGDSISFSANSPITLPAGGYFIFDGYNVTNQATSSISAAKVAGKANVATLYFTGIDTSIASFTTLDSTPVTYGGITTTGNLWMSHGSSNRFLNGGGILTAPTLTVIAGSIGTAADKLVTQLDTLTFTAQGEGAFITNHTAALPGAMSITGTANSSAPSGSVIISNYGATTIAAGGISADGSITVTANSPLTVAGAVTSTAGSVGLTSSNGDALTINSNVSASTGVSLTAGSGGTLSVAGGSAVTTSTGTLTLAAGSVAGSGTVGGVAAASASFTSTTPPPSTPVTPSPTVDACVANPSLTGCSTVLPTLDACVINPTAAGCSAVLPSIDACVANPTASGCSTVLPPLATCTTAPATPGCSAVLPTVNACVANPTAAGCSSVLPPLATCTTAPSTPGCSAVLPTVDACIANPTAAGCSTVLPPLATCTTAPSTPGCSAVLPTVDACVVTPTAAGCSSVLPSLATCATAPATAGCSAVLPTVGACVVTPTAAGCSSVLPPLATCATAPSTPGCSAVLPTVDACVANPTAAGCSTVLPPLATCTTAPATPGCSAVLPAPTLPSDQQLACLLDPAACVPGSTPPPTDTAEPILQQLQSSEQQLVLNSQIGQSDSGRPDLALMQTSSSSAPAASSGSGATSSTPGSTNQSAGEAQGRSGDQQSEEEQEQQNAGNNTPQGATNVPPQRRYCN